MSFTIAIIGRPNVGKSTLFNRLVGQKLALVDDEPGVTRDRREGEGRLGDLEFTLIDTAGLDEGAKGKGKQPAASRAPAPDAAAQDTAAAPDPDAAPEEEGGTAAAPPAPKAKKIVRRRTTAPPPDQPAAQSAPAARSQSSASPFPAPMPSGTFTR